MKILKLIVLGIVLSVSSISQAQLSVNVNVAKPPVWGPAVTTEQYYYLPEIESYYDVRQRQFISSNNGTWVRTSTLPSRFSGYNLNNGQVVIIKDYKGKSPYRYYDTHKVKYFKVKKFKPQGNNGNHYGHYKAKGNNGNNKVIVGSSNHKMGKPGHGGHQGKGKK